MENKKNIIEKSYNASSTEQKIYDFWENNKFFKFDEKSKKKVYTIVMPPPNITGALHMGHALDLTLQDLVARYKRMMGYEILWIPGTDHAALSTEAKVVEMLKKRGVSKTKLGYEKFMEECLAWKNKYGNKITQQIRKLGASCDWSLERFTLDKGCSKAVNEFFVRLYNKKLIYRGKRIVNWCPNCNTSISDIEVDFKESESELVYLKYFLHNDAKKFLVVATTRPETIFGDVAVAVNPSDERYQNFIGKEVIVPISGHKIKVIADNYVDKSFGTGVLKVTPAHDFADFEIGQRHNLENVNIINKNGTLNEKCGNYSGLKTSKARKTIIDELESEDLLVKKEKIKNNVGKCSRCNCTIEPLISTQWFLKMESLAKPAIKVVEDKSINFVPERFSKIYMHWMNNIKDWCISRQIWWGHRIPAYYCKDCEHITVSPNKIDFCEKCKSKNIFQDNDSLDTWFSSALWPFSVLGWPEIPEKFLRCYPTDLVITGYDIIFFWIARMIFSSIELTGKIPFKNVVIHGLVRDAQGRKMSKSLGNGIDPIEIIEKYGVDALRLTLVMGLTLGNDTRFSEKKIEGSRNFINKIWNAARFLKISNENIISKIEFENLSIYDKWILNKLNNTIQEIQKNMEKFEFGMTIQKIHSLFWDDFCDWYIEFSKINFKNNSSNLNTCCYILCEILKILHPFIPFVTEKIWSFFNNNALTILNCPEFNRNFNYEQDSKDVENIITIIHAIRIKRNEMNTPHNKKINIFISTKFEDLITKNSDKIKKMANVNNIYINKKINGDKILTCALDFANIMIPLQDLTNQDELNLKLKKELEDLRIRIDKNKNLLQNKNFIEKAPTDVVENIKNNLNYDEKKYSVLLNRFNPEPKN